MEYVSNHINAIKDNRKSWVKQLASNFRNVYFVIYIDITNIGFITFVDYISSMLFLTNSKINWQ